MCTFTRWSIYPMQEVSQFSKSVHRGLWPGTVTALPLFLTEPQLAHLLDRSVRTLQRNRRCKGKAWIPYKKIGRSIVYGRNDVLAHFGFAGGQAA
jgi:hypothetical protein